MCKFRHVGVLTCVTVIANACICFVIFFPLQMLPGEKAEALQEEVEELLKVPTDIPGTLLTNRHKEKS